VNERGVATVLAGTLQLVAFPRPTASQTAGYIRSSILRPAESSDIFSATGTALTES